MDDNSLEYSKHDTTNNNNNNNNDEKVHQEANLNNNEIKRHNNNTNDNISNSNDKEESRTVIEPAQPQPTAIRSTTNDDVQVNNGIIESIRQLETLTDHNQVNDIIHILQQKLQQKASATTTTDQPLGQQQQQQQQQNITTGTEMGDLSIIDEETNTNNNRREQQQRNSNETTTNGNNNNRFLDYIHEQNDIAFFAGFNNPSASSPSHHALKSSFGSTDQQQRNNQNNNNNIQQPPRPTATLPSSLRNNNTKLLRDTSNGTLSPKEQQPTTVLGMLQRGKPVSRNHRTVSWGDYNNDPSNQYDTTSSRQQQQQLQHQFIQDQYQQRQQQNLSNNYNNGYYDGDNNNRLPPAIVWQGNSSNNDQHNRTESGSSSLFGTSFSNLEEEVNFEDTTRRQQYSTSTSNNNNNNNKSKNDAMMMMMMKQKSSPTMIARQQQQGRSPQSSIELNDVLKMNPLETEAETLIMDAILARENAANATSSSNSNNNRQRAGTASSIFSSVTTEGASIFKTNSNDININTNDGGSGSIISNNDIMKPKPLNIRTATEGGNKPPFVSRPKDIVRNITTGQAKQHRRNHTMEQTLAGLSEAIAGISTVPSSIDSSKNHKQQQQQQQQLTDYSDTDDDIENNNNNNFGVAETFAENANLIYRGNNKKNKNNKEGRPPPSPKLNAQQPVNSPPNGSLTSGTNQNNWNVLKNAIMTGNPQQIFDTTHMNDNSLECKKKNDNIDVIHEGMTEHDDVNNSNNGESPDSPQYDPISVQQSNDEYNSKTSSKKEKKFNCCRYIIKSMYHFVKDFRVFTNQRREELVTYIRLLLLFVLPATGIAFILFYLAGNPPTGRLNINNALKNQASASASWWILFVCVRQAFTFTLARAMQTFVIDFLCLSTRTMVNVFGNLITLLIVQSNGWPFILFMWSIFNFGLLYGTTQFVQHWLYWQDVLAIFNTENPSGSVTANPWNRTMLTIGIVLSILVAIKRLWLGLFLGRKTYANYAEDLAKIMKKILCLCEVAALARGMKRDNEGRGRSTIPNLGMSKANFDGFVQETAKEFDDIDDYSFSKLVIDLPSSSSSLPKSQCDFIIDPNDVDKITGGLSPTQKMKLIELLGAWEGPEEEYGVEENPSISAILQFRHSLSLIDNQFMFSIAWGDVSWRDRMVLSSQTVYKNLLLRTPGTNLLSFDVLALSAKGSDDTLDHEKLKCLIRLFRPDRDGNLSLLEFVKSVDTVYKEAKLLRASVANSEKIDRAFERAINIIFYVIFICVTLSQIGYDPLALFLSLSSIILAFAFMIGTASSKMFEGFLLILIRRPYDIGDRIHISNIEGDTNTDGSLGWLVKDVDLFTTTVIYGSTNERATMSNGSITSSRIINMARSRKAIISIYNKYSTETPFERVQLFEEALRKFVKARPREWANFIAFRATKVMPDLGYIEYISVLQHRDSWQNITNILSSKAQVYSFCLELSNKLDMRYKSPPLPVDLAFTTSRNNTTTTMQTTNNNNNNDWNDNRIPLDNSYAEEVAALFEIRK